MKIAFLDVKTIGEVPNLSQFEQFGEFKVYQTTSKDQTAERIHDCEVVITNKVILDTSVLKQAKSLRLICISATGTNNVDLEYCRENNIVVKNAADYSTKSVAQSTFNSLFYLIHQTSYYDQYVKSYQYANSDIFTHIHHNFWELNGKKFGIIGLGNIGKEVAQLATAFGAEVVYHSTSGKNTNQTYKRIDLDELLESCDVISIHAPLNENTKNLIGEKELEKVQSHAVLINMGRGGIIDESALANALNENKIGGAALDVLEKEPIEQNHPLLSVKHPEKLFISPHNAWTSIEARTKLIDIVIQHLADYANNT